MYYNRPHSEEVGGDFVVACCDAPPLGELGEERLDAPAVFVGDLVVAVLVFAMALRRNDRFTALVEDHIMQSIGIMSAVCDDLTGSKPTGPTAPTAPIATSSGSPTSTATGRRTL